MKRVLGLAFALAGCTNGPAFTPAPPPGSAQMSLAASGAAPGASATAPEGMATLYIYRKLSLWWGTRTAKFYIDGVEVFDLNAAAYSYVYLTPGPHTISQKWTMFLTTFAEGKPLDLTIDVQPSGTHFVRMLNSGDISNSIMTHNWALEYVPESVGGTEIIGYKFAGHKKRPKS